MTLADTSGSSFRSFCSTLGLVLSCYAVYVEWKVHHLSVVDDIEEEFTALCDIQSIGASCRYVQYDTSSTRSGRLLSMVCFCSEKL